MSDYDNRLFSSDLTAFKSDGTYYTGSITFSGTLGASAEQIKYTDYTTLDGPDLSHIVYDNSAKHSGKWKDMILQPNSLVAETTFASDLAVILSAEISGNQIRMKARLLNAYGSSVSLQSTTFNFKYVGYEDTL